jgi:hypothetical protein
LFVTINKGHHERGLPMIFLGHEYLVDCFSAPFHTPFYREANKIGFDLEGSNPFTKRALLKIHGEMAPPTAWEVASNHMPSRDSAISPIPQPP